MLSTKRNIAKPNHSDNHSLIDLKKYTGLRTHQKYVVGMKNKHK